MQSVCIVNLEGIRDFARQQGERVSAEEHRVWLERAILRHVLASGDSLRQSQPSRFELASAHVTRAVAGGEVTFRFLPSAKLSYDVGHVVDWLVDLQEWDPRLARKLRRVSFENALAMSQRWHEQLQKAAERRKTRAIPPDPIGAPFVLAEPLLGPGWHWAWLKSPEARKAEGEAMGHCVGRGGYESLSASQAILSLRDSKGVPHVTMHLDRTRIFQSVSMGNDEVPGRYLAAVGRAAAIIGTRLFVAENPVDLIPDGLHRTNWVQACVRSEMLHCDEGPAVEQADGTTEWYCEGQLHRNDGPAVEYANGTKYWYRDGRFHRDDGPAVQAADGTVGWYCDGQLHREDGPAAEGADGRKEWYRDGRRHREDGPAVEWVAGTKEWYFNGKRHRDDGPAVERADGTTEWYRDGRRHRDDGPAIERIDRTKPWFRFWKVPPREYSAAERANRTGGTKEWYVDGKLHRTDGPAVEKADGGKEWYRAGERHREDGPAIERADGAKLWYRHGKLHREDGPAIERPDGTKEWYRHGERVSPIKTEQRGRGVKAAISLPLFP